MENLAPERAHACAWVISTRSRHAPPPEPFQLSFLSPLPGVVAGPGTSAHGIDNDHVNNARSQRRRRCRSLTREDVDQTAKTADTRALLRKPNGAFLPPLFARNLVIDRGGDVVQQGDTYGPADADTIIASAEALLSYRLRRGVKVLRDPYLLLRFLRVRLVSQRQPVFAAFFLDHEQRLIRFTELARGQADRVAVHPKEVVRAALPCGAEKILCVRSDPRGDHQPTAYDIEDACRVKRALVLLEIPLLDYVIVGLSVTSLLQRGVI